MAPSCPPLTSHGVTTCSPPSAAGAASPIGASGAGAPPPGDDIAPQPSLPALPYRAARPPRAASGGRAPAAPAPPSAQPPRRSARRSAEPAHHSAGALSSSAALRPGRLGSGAGIGRTIESARPPRERALHPERDPESCASHRAKCILSQRIHSSRCWKWTPTDRSIDRGDRVRRETPARPASPARPARLSPGWCDPNVASPFPEPPPAHARLRRLCLRLSSLRVAHQPTSTSGPCDPPESASLSL